MMKAQETPFNQMASRHDELLREVSAEYHVDPGLLRQLVDLENTKVHLERRRLVTSQIRQIIEKHLNQREQ